MPKQSPRPQLPPPTLDRTLRWLRIWYSVLLIAIVLYVLVSERAQHQLIDMNRAFLAGLGLVAVILVGIAPYGPNPPPLGTSVDRPRPLGCLIR